MSDKKDNNKNVKPVPELPEELKRPHFVPKKFSEGSELRVNNDTLKKD